MSVPTKRDTFANFLPTAIDRTAKAIIIIGALTATYLTVTLPALGV